MNNRFKFVIIVLSIAIFTAPITGCSIFISTPRTAKIHIQGLNNQHYDYIVPLDDPDCESNLNIKISKRYALQLDFEWLWDATIDIASDRNLPTSENLIPPLVPWMVCQYRF